jgi:hypothetical protein
MKFVSDVFNGKQFCVTVPLKAETQSEAESEAVERVTKMNKIAPSFRFGSARLTSVDPHFRAEVREVTEKEAA